MLQAVDETRKVALAELPAQYVAVLVVHARALGLLSFELFALVRLEVRATQAALVVERCARKSAAHLSLRSLRKGREPVPSKQNAAMLVAQCALAQRTAALRHGRPAEGPEQDQKPFTGSAAKKIQNREKVPFGQLELPHQEKSEICWRQCTNWEWILFPFFL